MWKSVFVMFLFLFLSPVQAGSQFCMGFYEGYKSIKGELSIVPICPIEPITPIGSSAFREGIKAGIKAAQS